MLPGILSSTSVRIFEDAESPDLTIKDFVPPSDAFAPSGPAWTRATQCVDFETHPTYSDMLSAWSAFTSGGGSIRFLSQGGASAHAVYHRATRAEEARLLSPPACSFPSTISAIDQVHMMPI